MQIGRNSEPGMTSRIGKSGRLRMLTVVIALLAVAAIACEREASEVNISALRERAFPAELLDDAEPLSSADVVSAYLKYFSGTRLAPRDAVATGEATAITDYCPDFTGTVVHNPPISGATFFWNISKPTSSRWNGVLLEVDFVDPAMPTLLGQEEGSTVTFPWSPATLESVAVFRSPDCAP